jgi:hypothetical protein
MSQGKSDSAHEGHDAHEQWKGIWIYLRTPWAVESSYLQESEAGNNRSQDAQSAVPGHIWAANAMHHEQFLECSEASIGLSDEELAKLS